MRFLRIALRVMLRVTFVVLVAAAPLAILPMVFMPPTWRRREVAALIVPARR